MRIITKAVLRPIPEARIKEEERYCGEDRSKWQKIIARFSAGPPEFPSIGMKHGVYDLSGIASDACEATRMRDNLKMYQCNILTI